MNKIAARTDLQNCQCEQIKGVLSSIPSPKDRHLTLTDPPSFKDMSIMEKAELYHTSHTHTCSSTGSNFTVSVQRQSLLDCVQLFN